ncbi:MAG: TrkA family potassium uptake protein [Chloroflexota bacterium]|nr:TrkA family potassium uptake protein [Chloroflexota bacterium]
MQVAVLGLGRFGSHLAEALDDLGHEVLAIDLDESNVHELAPRVTDARIADITDIDALRALSLGEVDVAVVATADLEASVLAMMNLQQLEVQMVYAKASTDRHARILRLLGAQRVIRPERDGAERFAHIIRVAAASDFLPLTASYGIGVFPIPATWVGQTVEWALERAGERRLIAVVRGDEVLLNPVMSERVLVGDKFVFSALDERLGEPLDGRR